MSTHHDTTPATGRPGRRAIELTTGGAPTPPPQPPTPASNVALLKALDLMPGAVFILTRELRIVQANTAAERRWHCTRDELCGMSLEHVLADDSSGRLSTALVRLRRGEEVAGRMPARARTEDGCSLAVQAQFHAVDPAGDGTVVAVIQAADEGIASLARDLYCDYLTALPVRAALEARMRGAERRARRRGSSFAVLFIDVDRFKSVNDRHGHLAGDHVLVACGQRLLACVRPNDFVARFGGDEFVAVIENVSAELVEGIAARIRDELKQPIEIGGQTLRISASVGVAIGDARSSARAILNHADRAMYRAKRQAVGDVNGDDVAACRHSGRDAATQHSQHC